MKYVKYFESFNPDDFDPDIITENIYQYTQEWPKTHWSSLLSIIEVEGDKPTLSQIKNGVENLIDEAKGSKLKSFFRQYESIINHGKLHIKLEEVEDLFLDINNYSIQKSNKYDSHDVFNILIDLQDVNENELQEMNNHIYGTVKKRLSDQLYIKRVTVLMGDDGKYDIKIRLFEKEKSIERSKDENINAIVDIFRRNLR